ncbi:IS1182 family transposase [Rhodoferax sp.]|uniref:IS1182 family transposase n=1 Tax=Rhodoferax sp. TaxID=50421 RepID=UPI001ECADFFA|nr:IS1182 family transposase [Rhodoferax sp.]MBT9508175.1 IS1182 family transposase [Rhodoferax sp.]
MKRFIEGQDRAQSILLPECLDDFVDEDNPVRVIDAFVGELDLASLGFESVLPQATGRPAYHPSLLLKIYIYGYLNRVQSSRRLEREAQRNMELMWLAGRLTPDFKTIANFRKDNGKAIRNVCSQFIVLCRQLNLFSQAVVAIDGSKFKAVNSQDKNLTKGKLRARLELVEANIAKYLTALDTADRQEPDVAAARIPRLQQKIASMRSRLKELRLQEVQLPNEPDQQISMTDPDSRSMATTGKGTGVVGYNMQAAVDTKNHLIVAHEVTNIGSDRAQLANMALKARSCMGKEELTVIADRGYFKGEEIHKCHQVGIDVIVPKPNTSNAKAEGRFDKADFVYIAKDDEYRCPAGQRAIYRFTREESGLQIRRYWSSACTQCAIKTKCTPSDYRRISRWEHESVLEDVQHRLDHNPEAMSIRRRTIEHVFGTLKHWMGSTHFQTRRIERVSTEMSLHILAYNLKRFISIFGIAGAIEAMQG